MRKYRHSVVRRLTVNTDMYVIHKLHDMGSMAKLIWILVIAMLTGRSTPATVVGPLNMAALVGTEVTLTCQVGFDEDIQWLRYESETDTNPVVIAFNENIIPSELLDYFEIDNWNTSDTVNFDLQVSSLRMGDGARYGCYNMAANKTARAYLIALGSDPNCESSLNLTNLPMSHDVRIFCSIGYAFDGSKNQFQQMAPRMAWNGPNPFAVVDESWLGFNSQHSANFQASSSNHGHQFSCTTHFIAPEPEPGLATNAPNYVYTWHSDILHVQGAGTPGNGAPGSATLMLSLITFSCTIITYII